MVFSEPAFLFWFFPALLGLHVLCPGSMRNSLLLVASLLFYAWGEGFFVLVMMASIVMNYAIGLWIEQARRRGAATRNGPVVIGVAVNLVLLGSYKYAGFVVGNLNVALEWLGLEPVVWNGTHLPIGISFFTFQAMSYVIDVHRGETEVQRNPLDLALYISMFPQLIAGPIVRYHDVAAQIAHRVVTQEGFASGVRRFVVGLGKKVIIANTVAWPADQIFGLPGDELTAGLAWLGAVCYALQIYFDFSGYSDMAIGLGRMFGFEFMENFNYPYIAGSVTEFWRRWHISLSTWFRDYLYIPLGGNRRGRERTLANLLIVFFLCGLWHGASWTFAVWGLYHGAFLIIERVGVVQWVTRVAGVRHVYVLAVVLVGWVFFRADSMTLSVSFLKAMVGLGTGGGQLYHTGLYLNTEVIVALTLGVVGSMPVVSVLLSRLNRWTQEAQAGLHTAVWDLATHTAIITAMMGIFILSASRVAASTYNPFIYFRF